MAGRMREENHSTTCPCCGGAIDPQALYWFEETGALLHAGLTARLAPQEFAVFAILVAAYPGEADVIAEGVGTRQSLGIAVSRVRQKLAPLGFAVGHKVGNRFRIGGNAGAQEALKRAAPVFRARASATAEAVEKVAVEAAHEEQASAAFSRQEDDAEILRLSGNGWTANGIAARLRLPYRTVFAAVERSKAQSGRAAQ